MARQRVLLWSTPTFLQDNPQLLQNGSPTYHRWNVRSYSHKKKFIWAGFFCLFLLASWAGASLLFLTTSPIGGYRTSGWRAAVRTNTWAGWSDIFRLVSRITWPFQRCKNLDSADSWFHPQLSAGRRWLTRWWWRRPRIWKTRLSASYGHLFTFAGQYIRLFLCRIIYSPASLQNNIFTCFFAE